MGPATDKHQAKIIKVILFMLSMVNMLLKVKADLHYHVRTTCLSQTSSQNKNVHHIIVTYTINNTKFIIKVTKLVKLSTQ